MNTTMMMSNENANTLNDNNAVATQSKRVVATDIPRALIAQPTMNIGSLFPFLSQFLR